MIFCMNGGMYLVLIWQRSFFSREQTLNWITNTANLLSALQWKKRTEKKWSNSLLTVRYVRNCMELRVQMNCRFMWKHLTVCRVTWLLLRVCYRRNIQADTSIKQVQKQWNAWNLINMTFTNPILIKIKYLVWLSYPK